ncbi:biotin-dependent carboxyltransferase family protein [Variovorax sp. J22G21]|uniref:5-oxoprolinase subunit C family protein n=1 Tax=Variovorax fucosicus TaxID=3053517 RepID=UPI00257801D3|nr:MULTISPECIES: biotin-dependent carboxyltransferase family protein [unclassified Variovorax]MDM0039947.1 biotin-dependent carboxyltransferase family protein [Variovorax sp. J22R193]MDM0061320.1 biotin-dependent carboxyltransferase family protein [Variovorax sp. J22G21]
MITVIRPGMLASVQDLGRHGHRHLGICPGGALDPLALTLANRLVGNPDGAAGLELTMGGCELRFGSATRIALAGDDFGARLDGQPVWPCWSMPVAAGQTLRLADANVSGGKPGLRSWLAVAGGIDVALVLGSRSTDLKAGFGGHGGRALRKNDKLPLGASSLSAAQRERRAFGLRSPAWDQGEGTTGAISLRVMPGPEYEQFTVAARAGLWSDGWRITPQSNRMGSRLAGPELKRRRSVDILSSGVIPGTIQVPPSGQPIILMGDAQTTGGYPRIGVVIRADLWKLAQAPLNGRLRLVEVDAAAAGAAWDAQQRHLAQVAHGLAAMGWPVAA